MNGIAEKPRQPAAPLAVVGIACLFPKADGFGAYWANIADRVDAIGPVPATHWRTNDYLDADPKAADRVYTARGGFLDPVAFAPGLFGIAPNDLEAIDTAQLLGLLVARQALVDAGYDVGNGVGKQFDRRRVGVILGVTGTLELVIPLGARLGHPQWRRALRDAGVPDAVAADVVQRIGESYVGWQENSFPGLLGNVVAGRIANRLDLGGTNCVVDAACASSLSALHLAALELEAGRADAVLTGGVDTFNDIFMYMCFSKTPALSPTGDARPFDISADGTILGEGLGMVVLKRLADAQRDGDRIYALVRGIGTASDGKGNAVYAPKAEGQVAALRDAYATAGIDPATVELVEAHGTGTRVGDAVEVAALTEVYQASGREGTWCALGSVKSQIGHTKAAAGAAGLIKAAAALYHKVLPPTLKVQKPLESLEAGKSPFYVNAIKRPWLPAGDHPRRAAVSAFGFGGSNFHCVLEEAAAAKTATDWHGDVQILAFCGAMPTEIDAQLAAWPAELSWDAVRTRAAATQVAWRGDAPYRLLLVVQRDRTELSRLLTAARAGLTRNEANWRSPEGIFAGRNAAPGKLAILFPGQGAQYPGMLRDLACQFPAVFDQLTVANAAFEAANPKSAKRLSDYLFPASSLTEQERTTNDEALRATDVAQPALGAISLGAWQLLKGFGVRPDAAAGHSYGEWTALCAAGVLGEDDFHRLSNVRGGLMANARAGAMLAVQATAAVIARVVAEEQLDLTLANRNAPTQSVLSGIVEEIERAGKAFSARNLPARRLTVGGAFHSPLVADAEAPLRAALDRTAFAAGDFPVFANSSACIYPADDSAKRELLAGQLVRPVEFVSEVEALYGFGVRTFLEVGPGARLTGLVSAILKDRGFEALALDASSGQRSGVYDLACVLAQLAARGHTVDLRTWDGDFRPASAPADERRPTLTVPLSGANYVKPRAPRPPVSANHSPPAPSNGPLVTTPRVAAVPSLQVGARENRSVLNRSAANSADGAALSQALQITRDTLATIQQMQEQTANLHRQFLEGQDAAQRTVQILIEQQQRLLQASLGLAQPVAPSASVAAPPVAKSPVLTPRPAVVARPPATAPAPTAAPVVAQAAPLVAPAPSPLPPSHAASSETPPASSQQRIETILVAVVAEKTGYPAEMLELDMALDADLGIDSIKRVEILAALQERLPDAPTVKPEHLGTLHSLRQIAAFLAGGAAPTASSKEVPAAPQISIPAPITATNRVSQILLEVVAEKTGYPAEMLELDMALDADLGIDSIKRVEILAALQEKLPDAPTVKPEHLGTLHSLRQIAAFLASEWTPATVPIETPVVATARERPPSQPQRTAAGDALADSGLERSVLRVAALPASGSRPSVQTPPRTEVWIAPDDDELAGCLERQLRRQGYETRLLSPVALREEDPPRALGGLVIVAPADPANDALLKDALRGLQCVAAALRQAARDGGAVFATVSRIDGGFGLCDIDPQREPVDGGLAGLTKTAGHEWPEVSCKAFDVAPAMDPHAAAVALAEELFLRGPVEVGITTAGRHALERVVEPLTSNRRPEPFAPGDVIVISGGARGVTAEVAVALARRYRPTLVLLGRSPAPKAEPEWLVPLRGEADIKREIASRANGSASPKLVGDQYAKLLAAREARETLARIESAGAKAVYLTLDVRQSKAVAGLLAAVRDQHGPIRGIVHGAGVLADARIEDKTVEQFERVYSTKVDGLRSLLAAVNTEELRALLLFSSSTGRLGRAGQADYAIANEVLNKVAWQQARRLPHCRVVAFNWGPWDGGMVTPALKRIFAGEGVPLIAPELGAAHLVRELGAAGPAPAEITILGGPLRERADLPAPPVAPTPPAQLPVAFERRLDLADHPVLESHVLDGRPVLPVALMLEWLAHAALQVNPGLAFLGCNDLRVLSGVVVQPDKAPRLQFAAGKAIRREGAYVAVVELRGEKDSGREILHARGEIVLSTDFPPAPPAAEPPATRPYIHGIGAIYDSLLFHGSLLHAIQQVKGCGEHGIVVEARTASAPADWLGQPLRQRWLADPLALDASFQALILWCLDRHAAGSLPCHVRRYRQYRRAFPAAGCRIVARVTQATALHALANIDFLDSDGLLVARLEGYECVLDAALQKAFRRNRLVAVPAS